jgi:hypothetical protein
LLRPGTGALLPAVLGLLLASTAVPLADTIRVTTWNLHSEAKAAPTASQITATAETLKTVEPDVILLQDVAGWEFCNQLVQALKPTEYNVLVCSAFRTAVTNPAQRQVAILARPKGYFSWSEISQTAEPSHGGYAFAALQFGGQRLGFFSAKSSTPSEAAQVAEQISKQATGVRNWTMNRVQALLVAASFDAKVNEVTAISEQTLRVLRQAGFVDGLSRLPAEQRVTFRPAVAQSGIPADWLYLEPSTFAGNVRVAPSAAFEHQPLTCDLELDPTKAAAVWVASAMEASATQRAATLASQKDASIPAAQSWTPWWVALIGGGALATVLLLLLAGRRLLLPPAPVHALLPNSFDPGQQTTPSSFTVVLAPQSATGARPDPAAPGSAPHRVFHVEGPGTTQTQSAVWQQRALAAEKRAEQAHAVIRRGLLPHLREWLKHFLFRKLITDRERLLEAQQAATRKALVVDERLARIEQQIKEQNLAYGRRIEDLECELASAKEENRELIRQRIAQVRAEMEAARAKLLAEAEERRGADGGKL